MASTAEHELNELKNDVLIFYVLKCFVLVVENETKVLKTGGINLVKNMQILRNQPAKLRKTPKIQLC